MTHGKGLVTSDPSMFIVSTMYANTYLPIYSMLDVYMCTYVDVECTGTGNYTYIYFFKWTLTSS